MLKGLAPCIAAIQDDINNGDQMYGSPTHKNATQKTNLLNRIIGIATSTLSGQSGSRQNGNDIGQLIVRQVQEKVMDYLKDQIAGGGKPGSIPGFASGNLLLKLNQFLRPADNSIVANKQIFNFGEKGSGFRAKSTESIQDFDQIRKKCLENGNLFEDNAFPTLPQSLFYTSQRSMPRFEWRRPTELVSDPKFITEDASRFDVKQGELGDCWLLAAIANLTLNQELFHVVVPHNQCFDENYAGVFHFRFWQYGKWIDVVIDDRLPTVNGKLMFMHSEDHNEFWSALLEKAYAKLHGSYEALKGGSFGEAVEDFTGGIAEFYEIQSEDCPENLYSLMKKAHERNSFMGCSINALTPDQIEMKLQNGIIMGHAYSITDIKEVPLKTARVQGKIPLIRVRNPWGNEAEWKGPWSDNSKEWTLVTDEEKKRLNLEFKHDGEFWISYSDFKKNFTNLEICNLNPQSLHDEEHEKIADHKPTECHKHWEAKMFEGAWISGVTAGGCRNYLHTYAMNPQYLITLVDHDEEDENNKCTLIVALMQKNRRIKRKMGLDTLTIGFAIYEIKDNMVDCTDEPLVNAGYVRKQLLTTEFFKYNASVARSPNFINLREVTSRVKLPPGKYCIIPSTFEPNEEGEFLLRIFTEKPPKECIENDDEVGIISDINDRNVNDDKENEIDNSDTPTKQKSFSPTPAVVQNFFAKVAGDDMEVDANELQQVLNYALKKVLWTEYKFDGFSLESCRSMVAMLDEDKSGKLGIDEFIELWKQVKSWCDVFKVHDKDGNHLMNATELRESLLQARLSANRHILQSLILRYGHITSKKDDYKVERSLTFDAFILCCIKLKHCIDIWSNQAAIQNLDSEDDKMILPNFSLDHFVETMMYS